jgi:hypothetical protein
MRARRKILKSKGAKRRRTLPLLGLTAAVAMAVGLFSAASALASTQVDWTGQGTTDGQLNTEQCDSNNTPYLHWVFTGQGATNVTITINGTTYNMTHVSQNSASWFYDSGYLDPLDPSVQDVYATYDGTVTGQTNLVISHGCSGTQEHFGTISGYKYYDSNGNGKHDYGEPKIPNWPIDVNDSVSLTVNTDSNGDFSVPGLAPDTYNVAEQLPTNSPPWAQTGNLVNQSSTTGGASVTLNADKSYTVDIPSGQDSTASGVKFGNICLGKGGGLTLGFWSNKNGKKLIAENNGDLKPAVKTLLVSLNLRNADGSNFDPANYGQLRTWLLGATATNMAYMLSAQLAAMELNVWSGKVQGNAYIYAPEANGANANGYITVNALMSEANMELGLHGTALSGDAWRSYQEGLKNALDRGNNDQNVFIQAPGSCPTPVFPPTS